MKLNLRQLCTRTVSDPKVRIKLLKLGNTELEMGMVYQAQRDTLQVHIIWND